MYLISKEILNSPILLIVTVPVSWEDGHSFSCNGQQSGGNYNNIKHLLQQFLEHPSSWHHWQIYFLTSFRVSKPVMIYLSYIDSYGAAGWQWQVKLDIYGCLPQDIFSINRSSKLLHILSNEEEWAGRLKIIIRRFFFTTGKVHCHHFVCWGWRPWSKRCWKKNETKIC